LILGFVLQAHNIFSHHIYKNHLIREGYPEESIYLVGNSVVDSIYLKRRELKPAESIFNIYPKLEFGEWLRMDIHRRENLTPRRFESIVNALVSLIKNTEHKVVPVMLNVTKSALRLYHFDATKSVPRISRKIHYHSSMERICSRYRIFG
jgi:UDP-N-acetylglucosamine 2-epimerase